ncbi:MAG: hypothetical protein IPO08_23375 [Xanthomonadales bacterium]|nr:hypothetical protein [Xanthomonadales bacterium]
MKLTPEQIDRKLAATPKDQMFGRLWQLGTILHSADFPEREKAIDLLIGAMTWDPLIASKPKDELT